MLYAILKAVHLLGVIVWVGGMFFMLACLRPAASALEPPLRVKLMHETMRRFFSVVSAVVVVLLASGAAMLGMAAREATRTGLAFNMPLDWYAMTAIFVVMVVVFAHVRLALFRRLERAIRNEAWPVAGAVLNAIRWEVLLNLVLGSFVVVLVRLGGNV
ncbi:MAG: CopD family protein [Pseudomonadota bacterium]|nr:CopD family protein [Pseudomonadota bacterium]